MLKRVYEISIIFFISLFVVSVSQAQNNFMLKFEPMFNNQSLILNDVFYKLPNSSDSVEITKLKFYISAIEFYNNDKLVFTENNSFHLVDAANETSLQINIHRSFNTSFNKIKFNLGIDSNTNVKGALGGDLDPTKGMYWAWHSGYINFKLEGTSNVCKTRNNAFEFHLGGFQAPNNSLQKIELAIVNTSSTAISVDMAKCFSQINLKNTNMIMTPSKESVELSKIAATMFSVKK